MNRDQFNKCYLEKGLFKRNKDGKYFKVIRVTPLTEEHIFLVKYKNVKEDGKLGRKRFKDLISFCKTFESVET